MKQLQIHLGVSLMLTVCLFLPEPVLAEEGGETTGIYTLGEVVVRGARQGVEGVSTVREVTAQEIQNKGARTPWIRPLTFSLGWMCGWAPRGSPGSTFGGIGPVRSCFS